MQGLITQSSRVYCDGPSVSENIFALRRRIFHPEPGRAQDGLSATAARFAMVLR